jgi:hypothetical protein
VRGNARSWKNIKIQKQRTVDPLLSLLVCTMQYAKNKLFDYNIYIINERQYSVGLTWDEDVKKRMVLG